MLLELNTTEFILIRRALEELQSEKRNRGMSHEDIDALIEKFGETIQIMDKPYLQSE